VVWPVVRPANGWRHWATWTRSTLGVVSTNGRSGDACRRVRWHVRAAMMGERLDALLVAGKGTGGPDAAICAVHRLPSQGPGGLLLILERRPCADPQRHRCRQRRGGSPMRGVMSVVRGWSMPSGRKGDTRRIGIADCGESCRRDHIELRSALPDVVFVDADDLMDRVRAAKTPLESSRSVSSGRWPSRLGALRRSRAPYAAQLAAETTSGRASGP
jgi:hypothetical protein